MHQLVNITKAGRHVAVISTWNEDFLEILSRFLKSAGYDVTLVPAGSERKH